MTICKLENITDKIYSRIYFYQYPHPMLLCLTTASESYEDYEGKKKKKEQNP